MSQQFLDMVLPALAQVKLATLGDVLAIEKKLKKNSRRKKLSRAIYAAALQRALGFGHRALAEKLGAQGFLPNLFFPDSGYL